MESCLYEGVLHHERLMPVRHRFHYRLFLAYLDLAELPSLERSGWISTSRYGLASFRHADHVGDPWCTLDHKVRDLVEQASATRPEGCVRVLTQLSCLGYYFSPLNLFHCFEPDGRSIQAVVAEVQNTPWLQRHAYVLWEGNRETGASSGVYRHPKTFHVSPFMGMNIDYRWRLQPPGETLNAVIENLIDGEPMFRASLHLRRVPLTTPNRRRLLIRYPLLPFRITAAIYWQAFQLWRKKCPYYPYPKYSSPRSPEASVDEPSSRISFSEPFAKASHGN